MSKLMPLLQHLKAWAWQNEGWIAANGLKYFLRLCSAFLLFFIGKWFAERITSAVGAAMHRSHVDETLVRFFTRITNFILIIVVIVIAADVIGVKSNSIVAMIGAAGLAIGLAMQGSLSNFAAGILIIMFRPFRVGDYIETVTFPMSGTVDEISILNTYLVTSDNRLIICPNSTLTSNVVVNHSSRHTRRLELTFNVPFKNGDIEPARQAILRATENDPKIIKDPKPSVGISKIMDTVAELTVFAWVNVPDVTDERFLLNENIKRELTKAGY